MQPFIMESGPWRATCTDYDVSAAISRHSYDGIDASPAGTMDRA